MVGGGGIGGSDITGVMRRRKKEVCTETCNVSIGEFVEYFMRSEPEQVQYLTRQNETKTTV